jgi:glycosyltransferase involved in cell wall biosynthesis
VNDAGFLHPDIGIIALAPEAWAARRQARHQFIGRLSRRFPTIWVNPAHERSGIAARLRSGDPPWGEARGAPDLTVYTPEAWLPQIHRPAWAARRLDGLRLARARHRLLARGARRIVLSIWRPGIVDALGDIAHDAALYHVNDEYSFRADAPIASQPERELLAWATVSYFSSRALLERKGPLARRAEFLPNGVDYAAFATPRPEPADLARVPRPRVGYTGWVKQQLDWDLIEALARLRPDLHFAFVGGVSPQPGLAERIAPLSALPNVHFLGGKSSEELADYPQHLDVCAMPYVVDGYTRYIYPLKLHEYLASGRPAIGTPIPALEEFSGLIRLAGDPGSWSAALDDLLGPASSAPVAVAARQAVARAHDWDVLTDRLAADILALLGRG